MTEETFDTMDKGNLYMTRRKYMNGCLRNAFFQVVPLSRHLLTKGRTIE